jgi:hypothetical protein
MVKNFNDYLNESKSFSEYSYQMYYSKDNMASANGANSEKELISLAKKLKLNAFAIYKNGQGFHSTAQEEHLLSWYDSTGHDYWTNRSKKEPELLKKKIEKLDEGLMDDLISDSDNGIKQHTEYSDKPVFVLWADRVSDNYNKALKKAMYKGKSNKVWNREYVRNATLNYGTVFFIDANNVPEAKSVLNQALKYSAGRNIYYFGINSKNTLDNLDWLHILN